MRDSHPIDRARLTERAPLAPPVARYQPAGHLASVIRHFWVPVWDLPQDNPVVEEVLQYPTPLMVIAGHYARFYGVARGLSTVTLEGRGWAVGVMLAPGAGPAVAGGDVGDLVDTHRDLTGFAHLEPLVEQVRGQMAPAPADPDRHAAAIRTIEQRLARALPLDDEALLLNDVVQLVESDPDLLTVSQLVERLHLPERTLQRLTGRYLGLTPKWLIQRRRLHEATDRLKHGSGSLARIAADLGYTDQAHFTRDFRRVTGHTPGGFARTMGRGSDPLG